MSQESPLPPLHSLRSRTERIQAVQERIEQIWCDVLAISPDKVNHDPHVNVIGWITDVGCNLFDSLDFEEFMISLESSFGVDCSSEEFHRLFTPQPILDKIPGAKWHAAEIALTNRQLWEWIADAVPVYNFQPVNIAGQLSAPAGAYFGMRDLLARISPRAEIAPSLPIQPQLKAGNLMKFWDQLQLHSGVKLPDVQRPYARIGDGLLTGGAAVTLISIGVLSVHWGGLWLLKSGVWMARYGWKLNNRAELPAGIATFGDLARRIADEKSA